MDKDEIDGNVLVVRWKNFESNRCESENPSRVREDIDS